MTPHDKFVNEYNKAKEAQEAFRKAVNEYERTIGQISTEIDSTLFELLEDKDNITARMLRVYITTAEKISHERWAAMNQIKPLLGEF